MKGVMNREGSILIDVLLASIILAIGICSAMAVIQQWDKSDREMAGIQAAGFLAQDGFEAIRSHCAGNWTYRCVEEKSGSERLRRNGCEYNRTISLTERADLDAERHLVEARIKISWTVAGSLREKDFVTYYLVNLPVGNLR